MNSLNSLGKNTFGVKNFFKSLEESVHREQKDIFFHRRNQEDETDYFNFIKFLFNDPQRV
jgi:hypothetical protein